MDVVAFVVILLALTAFVAAPLYRRVPEPPAATVEERREAVIGLLRELEWDHRDGLVDDAEYRDRRRALETEAVELFSTGD
jgi:hypothetical protein